MLAQRRRRGVILQGSIRNRLEGAEVNPRQIHFSIESRSGREELAIGFIGSPHHELGGLADRGVLALALLNEACCPMQGLEEMGGEVLRGSDAGQAFRVRCLQVHRDPIGELHRSFHVGEGSARQDLEVDVAGEGVAVTHQFNRGDHAVHGTGRIAHAGAEEEALHQLLAVHLVEGISQLLRGEANTLEVAAHAVSAIVAIVLAGVGEQHLEEVDRFAIGQHGRVDPAVQVIPPPVCLRAACLTAQIILS